ncbi:sigma-70 family RNA polymerase sigma factor [Bacillus pumilus]|uniref:RNA polymerase sigma factor n=1 Tax=Bacillus pumilus TaxID=1408 RepID=UPI000F88B4C2|nr:sigma-70 family RNA polymerase sigma factor [Bacillus pumilus]RST67912.1 sigma-70 family RNA polymerase sigma factor [Bacillus pumilus]WHX45687.1 sigma-70 family RNA polymerase sigma factor [Bacillus pumilus]
MDTLKDSELYHKIKFDRHKPSLEVLYDRYERVLYSFIYKMTGSRELTEEVLQEVFIKLWRGIGEYHTDKGKFSSWLFMMSRNTAIDLLRKHRNETALEDEHIEYLADHQEDVSKEVEWNEEKQIIREAVSTLSKEQQTIIEDVYFKGMTQKSIAEKLGIPIGTVKGRVRLSLKHLRTRLSRGGKEEEA